jgi:dTDP-4-dehydrorhamnose 3,5-epimerase-like enzyme|tara:strand:+ start:8776 stop:9174 length:399 start_codon:yes stop_codon:yes gene_type:complete
VKNNIKCTLGVFEDYRGCLLPIEFTGLGFDPKRVFVVNSVPVGDVRGNHSHHKTKQYIICTNGSVNVMLDDGKTKKTTKLNKNQSIMVPELVWDSQEFLTEDAEILVICSTEYNIEDYILTYDEFIKVINQR